MAGSTGSDYVKAPEAVQVHTNPVHNPSTKKGVIIGLYGLPGCGKSFALEHLKSLLDAQDYISYEGSQVIDKVVPGGLRAFQNMTDQEKTQWRQVAISNVAQAHADSDQMALVTGHYMFWPELDGVARLAWTKADSNTYTHILYLDTPASVIAHQSLTDTTRSRSLKSVEHLHNWQEREKYELRQQCYDYGILFSCVPSGPTRLKDISNLISSFCRQSQSLNLDAITKHLNALAIKDFYDTQTIVMMDADRTLTPSDTGKLFWKEAVDMGKSSQADDPLSTIFNGPQGYAYSSFQQAALLYKESFDDNDFNKICANVAGKTELYPQFVCLLHTLSTQRHIGIMVVTCGLQKVWETILGREGLGDKVKIIGAGNVTHGHIVTAEVKAHITTYLKSEHHKHIIAVGDSPLDMKMFQAADLAIVVVGDEKTRSKSMERVLDDAINHQSLQAWQVVIPSSASPRADTQRLPLMQPTSQEFIGRLLREQYQQAQIQVENAMHKPAAQILMTGSRDASKHGPNLRKIHRRIGNYLALEYCSEIIGLEPFAIPHVQDKKVVEGHRLYHESQTIIVALMRGGESMAFGVNDAFPEAMFLHAKDPEDIKPVHLEDRVTVILVDSVINTGRSVIEFVQHINKIHATVRIVIVTGVAQAESIDKLKDLQQSVKYNRLSLVTLRISKNKYTGSGPTDTGNRLFNTTSLP